MSFDDAFPPPKASHRRPPSASGLLTMALVVTVAAAVGAAAWGVRSESPMALAVALQFSLAAVAVWGARDAASLRLRGEALDKMSVVQPQPAATSDVLAGDDCVHAQNELSEFDGEDLARELEEARSVHFLFLAAPTLLVGFLAAFRLATAWSRWSATGDQSALATIFLLSACGWHTLARIFQGVPEEDLPEAKGIAEALRESTWSTLIAGIGLLVGSAVPAASFWSMTAIVAWVVIVAAEQALRAVLGWCLPRSDEPFRSPVRLLLREAVLMRSNPIASLFAAIEQRSGLSLRSSWALAFIRQALRPTAIAVALLVWGVSSLAVVDSHQWGVQEHFGRVVGDPLPPGLHAALPWPLGRVRVLPVKTVSTMQIGFRDENVSGRMAANKALLWTRPHNEEFALVLGTGTELVAVNAVVYYKISETPKAFRDYIYYAQSPEQALEAFAYEILTEETRTRSLAEILTLDRAAFVNRIRKSLQQRAGENRLGLEVIDVALVNLHPPVDAAGDYLDTISAAIDADRDEIEARGQVAVERFGAQQERQRLVSQARIEADRRLGTAAASTAAYQAAREIYDQEGKAFQTRLVLESLGELFRGKRLVLIDRELAQGASEILVDLRNLATPEIASTPPVEEPQP
ncbi:MAG: SPFH domain-containing protein [Planctomycetaceae bacterium]